MKEMRVSAAYSKETTFKIKASLSLLLPKFLQIMCNALHKSAGTSDPPWVKALAPKPDNSSLTPGTHMVGGQNSLLQVVLWSPHLGHGMHVCTHTHNKYNK